MIVQVFPVSFVFNPLACAHRGSRPNWVTFVTFAAALLTDGAMKVTDWVRGGCAMRGKQFRVAQQVADLRGRKLAE
jgi:hypothetical protein